MSAIAIGDPVRGGCWDVTLASSAARTVTGNGGAILLPGSIDALRIQLDVIAASGTTPSLTVLVEDSIDGTNWNTVGTFAAKTAAGREVVNVTGLFAPQVRASWTVSGTTPSFTFSVRAIGR